MRIPRTCAIRRHGAPWWSATVFTAGLAVGCGDTVDLVGVDEPPQAGTSGSGSSSSNVDDTGTTADVETGSSTGSTDESGTQGEVQPCARLDLLFVVDNTLSNGPMVDAVFQRADAVEAVLRDPSAPWSEDFHVGVVLTQDTGPVADCRVSGALSAQPGDPRIPCETAGGGPWASADDAELAATLECLGTLTLVGDRDRRVALAAGRGIGAPLPGDTNGDSVGTCNQGFHRADAVSVLVVLSAGDDLGSPGDALIWSETLASGNAAPQIVIGMVPESIADETCPGPATRLLSWLYYEPDSSVLDVCNVDPTDAAEQLATTLAEHLEAHCTY